MASLDDILTTQKNGVVAINGYINALNRLAGTNSSKEIAPSTTQLIKSSGGWLATISVIVTGSTCFFYDTNNVNNLTGNRICAVTPSALGVIQLQIPFSTGLVIVTGATSVVSVSYT
jgi:hypothetical protein